MFSILLASVLTQEVRTFLARTFLSRYLFQWSFSADMLAVDPDESYRVSVYNIPRPELHHSHYDVSAEVTAPGEVLVVKPFSVRSV